MDQVDDMMQELKKAKANNERAFIITLTIRMAEDLSEYLKQKGLKVTYLHNKLGTMERSKVLGDLRRGRYDAIIGINLLREGLDIPEVALITIFDADKEGFLRNTKSLIQIIGRAARNLHGRVIMYADRTTDSMARAIDETNRRRSIQEQYNIDHNINPQQIKKDLRDDIKTNKVDSEIETYLDSKSKHSDQTKRKFIGRMRQQMQEAAKNQDYEKAAELRDMIMELEAGEPKKD
jgi:excinuclease ABC subunit B